MRGVYPTCLYLRCRYAEAVEPLSSLPERQGKLITSTTNALSKLWVELSDSIARVGECEAHGACTSALFCRVWAWWCMLWAELSDAIAGVGVRVAHRAKRPTHLVAAESGDCVLLHPLMRRQVMSRNEDSYESH